MSLSKVAYEYSEQMEKQAILGWLKKLLWDAPKAGVKASARTYKNLPQNTANWANKNAKPATTPGSLQPSGLLDASGKPMMTQGPDVKNKLTLKNRFANRIQNRANKWSQDKKMEAQEKAYGPTIQSFDNIKNMPKVRQGLNPASKTLAITAGGAAYVQGKEGVPAAQRNYEQFQLNRLVNRESKNDTILNQGTSTKRK